MEGIAIAIRPACSLGRRQHLLLVMWLLLVVPAVLQAQFTYTTNNGTITIKGYTGPGGAVAIPSTINGLAVTSIGTGAFNSRSSLTSITIPDSVSTIGSVAFLNCSNLARVTIPEGVISIGSAAFRGSGLISVTIPSSVTSIGVRAFAWSTNLTEINVSALNPVYRSVSGVLFSKDESTLVECPPGKAGSYAIPDSVIRIGDSAFESCVHLTSVALGTNVTGVGGSALYACYNLTNVSIADSVTSIGNSALGACRSLTSIAIPGSVVSIGIGAFSYCTNLSRAPIPNSVIAIGAAAFSQCFSLTAVTIGDGVMSIGEGAFSHCSSLTDITVDPLNSAFSSVDGVLFNQSQSKIIEYPEGKAGSYVIPGSVKSIGDYAFSDSTSLTAVTIPNSVTNIGVSAFGACASLTTVTIGTNVIHIGNLAFENCFSLSSIVLPDSLISMGSAFYNCIGLTNVMIGNSVTSLGASAFKGCAGLSSLTIPGSVTSIGAHAFGNSQSQLTIYFEGNAPTLDNIYDVFPVPALIYYLPGTEGWGSTFGSRRTILWSLPAPLILTGGPSFGVQTNTFGFRVSWATNIDVVVEACNNLGAPVWSPVSTNTLTDGWFYFSDPVWTNYSTRLYRVRSQ